MNIYKKFLIVSLTIFVLLIFINLIVWYHNTQIGLRLGLTSIAL